MGSQPNPQGSKPGKIDASAFENAEKRFLEGGGEFREFKLSELFEIKTSKSVDKGSLEFTGNSEDIEFIGRTSVNNGIQGYIKKLHFEPNPKNTFSVIQVGENIAQFRNREWYASQNLFVLTPKDEMLSKNKLFSISSINAALKKFSGGYSSYPTLRTLNDLDITLPTDKSGKIAFKFMEERIKELEHERIKELEAYLTVTGLKDTALTAQEARVLADFENMISNSQNPHTHTHTPIDEV